MDGMEEFNENFEIVQNVANIQDAVLIQNENSDMELEMSQSIAAMLLTEHKKGWQVYLAARDGHAKLLMHILSDENESEG